MVLDRTHCELLIVRSSLRLVFDRSLQRANGRSSARSGLSIIPVRNRPDHAQAPSIFACCWHCPTGSVFVNAEPRFHVSRERGVVREQIRTCQKLLVRAPEQGLYLPKVPRPRGPCYGFSPRRCHGCPSLGTPPCSERDSSHAVYWRGTYPRRVIYSCGA